MKSAVAIHRLLGKTGRSAALCILLVVPLMACELLSPAHGETPQRTSDRTNTPSSDDSNASNAHADENNDAQGNGAQDGQDADLSWVAQFMESVSQIGQAFRNIPSKVDEIKAVWGEQDKGTGLRVQSVVNLGFEAVVGILGSVLFFEIPIIVANQKAPLILLTLLLGGMFFTLRWSFINVRLFVHCINVIRGKYDRPEDKGEITHFQALTSALSATVGLGNIAGVAIAISKGGPGAVFWMWVVAFFGMSLKFTSCSLAQLYRRIKPDGSVLGGPMVYLDQGIRERFGRLKPIGKLLGVVFACFTIMAAFGGGNMFQGNQTYSILSSLVIDELPNGPLAKFLQQNGSWLVGLVMAVLVGLVIIGGIRRIGEVTSKLVPLMCGFYCLCCLLIVLQNYANIPKMFESIFADAFNPDAMYGGMIGVLLTGATRAAFSNEAGLGSAAIAHAAAKTDEPVREGIVAMIGPFVDTIVVCTMTALTILITKSHLDMTVGEELKGITITAAAFSTLADWVPRLLCIAVFVFAYSSMISWSYYGERAIEYLIGDWGILPYRIVYVLVVVLGPVLSLSSVVNFSDIMLLSMAFPNIIGMVFLSGVLSDEVSSYVARLRSGEIRPSK